MLFEFERPYEAEDVLYRGMKDFEGEDLILRKWVPVTEI